MGARSVGRALAAGALVALVVAAGGSWLRGRWAAELWSVRSDNAPLALGQALNMEMASRGALPRPVTYYQLYHPGLPFQLASWLALRLGSQGSAEPLASALEVLRDPSGFWRWAGRVATLLTLVGLLVSTATSRHLPAAAVVAVAASYFCLDSAWVSGFLLLTNDSFALPLAVVLFALSRGSFAAERPPAARLAAAGAVAALAYLCKLPYIVWTLAFLAGLVVRALGRGELKRGRWLAGAFSFGAGWLVLFGLATWALMTPASVAEMLRLHLGTAANSGYHSNGPGTLVNGDMLRFALTGLLDHPLLLLMLGVMVTAMVGAARTRMAEGRPTEWPFATMLVVAIALGLAAALKHYKVYYLLVPLAVVPPALAWSFEGLATAWRTRLSVTVLTLVAASFASQALRPPMDLPHWARYVPWQGAQQEISAVERLPLEEGEVRAWSYGCSGRGYYRLFAAGISGYGELLARVEAEYPLDRTTDEAPPNWRYAVFEWNLQDPAAAAEPSRKLFGVLRAQFQAALAQGEPLPGFERYVVIERRSHTLPPAAR